VEELHGDPAIGTTPMFEPKVKDGKVETKMAHWRGSDSVQSRRR